MTRFLSTLSVNRVAIVCSVLIGQAMAGFGVWAQTGQEQRVERRVERAVQETQADQTYRLRIDPSLSFSERNYLDVGGSFTFTALHLVDANDENRRLLQPELTLYGRAVLDRAHTFFFRSRFRYREFSDGDSFDGNGDSWEEPYIDRFWYEFDLGRAVQAYEGQTSENNFNFRIGRQFVEWGQGLVLSEQLHAVVAEAKFGKLKLTGLAGVTPTDESITDFDASRVGFDTNTERAFFGGEIRYTTVDSHEFYFSYVRMADWNSDGGTVAPLGGVPVQFDYESNYFIWGAEGSFGPNLAYEGEFVFQSGKSTADPLRTTTPTQQTEDISAFAARTQLTWFLADENRSRVEFETILASGDDDRNISTDTVAGNRPGTDDNAFNSLGFANTGLAFSPSLSNLMVYRLGASTFPFQGVEALRDFQIGLDLFLHNKLEDDAPIDEITQDSGFLGFEMDVSVNWRVSSDFSLSGRYGMFLPGDAFSSRHTRHFVFLGAVLSF